MINYEDLQFGDVVYVVESKSQFYVKKISFIDVDGITWWRYPEDKNTFTTLEIMYCGKVSYLFEGKTRLNEEHMTEYHFEYPDGQICGEYEYDGSSDETWFRSLEEANEYIKQQKELSNEL